MGKNHPEKIHATCIEVNGLGILLRGPSGSGKSDLALRLIDTGANLIADDYTELRVLDGQVMASAPEKINNLIEVRGIGLLNIDSAAQARVGAVIDLVKPEDVERLPEEEEILLMGLSFPRFKITPFESSAPAKVRFVTRLIKGDVKPVS